MPRSSNDAPADEEEERRLLGAHGTDGEDDNDAPEPEFDPAVEDLAEKSNLDAAEATIDHAEPALAASESQHSVVAEQEPLLFNRNSFRSLTADDFTAPVVHYHSLSVHLHVPNAPKPRPGALTIIQRDTGGPDDLFSIDVQLRWKSHARTVPLSPDSANPITVSVDELLALRIVLGGSPHPRVMLHARGGRRIATFFFPNGRDAAMAFVTALRMHVDASVVADRRMPGELFTLEAKPRMRRVAPSIDDGLDAEGGDPSGSPIGFGSGGSARRRPRSHANVRDPDSGMFQPNAGMMVLENFARVTQLARDVGDDFQWLFSEKRRKEDATRRERERLARERALDIYADIAWTDSEADGNRQLPPCLTLEHPRGVPVSKDNWTAAFGENGVLIDPAVMRLAIFAGGVDPEIRPDVWPFLLGVFAWESSAADRDAVLQKNLDRYAEIKSRWLNLKSEATNADASTAAKALETAMAAAKATAGRDGADAPDVSDIRIPERSARVSKLHSSYLLTLEQIAKDIVRTDRLVDAYKQDNSRMLAMMGDILNVYAVYNKSIGYCQGMSDFMSPLLHVLGEHQEAHAFWCFEALMQRYQDNFRMDQAGMTALLARAKTLLKACDQELYAYFEATDPDFYCIFRWMLVCFKRELSFESTSRLWEILWTRQVGDDTFHVNVAIALLRAHRRNLLKLERGGFDTLLRYVNDMSQRIDVDFAVRQAELLHRMVE
jgi:hypothetical protein